jgi:hypothetical protein
MTTPDTFLAELETKSQGSLDRLVAAFREVSTKESLSLADFLKLEVKYTLENTEAAALWLVDTDGLPFKMSLADACGGGARRYERLAGRLAALGVEGASFDPLVLGYSKLFAFLRSLQTTEERASAIVAQGRFARQRFALVAELAKAQSDGETASLLADELPLEEERQVSAARTALLAAATGEEGQARGRRAAFRVFELQTELLDPTILRKFLSRSTRKPVG